MLLELWRPISDGDDEDEIFAVSNHGHVLNMLTQELMPEHIDEEVGYVWVNLLSGEYRVDELVADAFICCIGCDLWEIRHIDGDPLHNAVWNLCMTLDEDHIDHLEGCLNCE